MGKGGFLGQLLVMAVNHELQDRHAQQQQAGPAVPIEKVVTVEEGWEPGSTQIVRLPRNVKVQVIVPRGLNPGDTFLVQAPVPSSCGCCADSPDRDANRLCSGCAFCIVAVVFLLAAANHNSKGNVEKTGECLWIGGLSGLGL